MEINHPTIKRYFHFDGNLHAGTSVHGDAALLRFPERAGTCQATEIWVPAESGVLTVFLHHFAILHPWNTIFHIVTENHLELYYLFFIELSTVHNKITN